MAKKEMSTIYDGPMSPETQKIALNQFENHKREYTTNRLKYNFPSGFSWFFSILYIVLAIVSIVLHFILIKNKAKDAELGYGIWGGVLMFIIVSLNVYLTIKRTYKVYIVVVILIPVISVLVSVAFISLPSIALGEYSKCVVDSCLDPLSQAINWVFLFIGIGSALFIVVYAIVMRVVLLGSCKFILAQMP